MTDRTGLRTIHFIQCRRSTLNFSITVNFKCTDRLLRSNHSVDCNAIHVNQMDNVADKEVDMEGHCWSIIDINNNRSRVD